MLEIQLCYFFFWVSKIHVIMTSTLKNLPDFTIGYDTLQPHLISSDAFPCEKNDLSKYATAWLGEIHSMPMSSVSARSNSQKRRKENKIKKKIK